MQELYTYNKELQCIRWEFVIKRYLLSPIYKFPSEHFTTNCSSLISQQASPLFWSSHDVLGVSSTSHHLSLISHAWFWHGSQCSWWFMIITHTHTNSTESIYSHNPMSHVWLKIILVLCDRLGKKLVYFTRRLFGINAMAFLLCI